jgi:hypothetical protein
MVTLVNKNVYSLKSCVKYFVKVILVKCLSGWGFNTRVRILRSSLPVASIFLCDLLAIFNLGASTVHVVAAPFLYHMFNRNYSTSRTLQAGVIIHKHVFPL